MTKKILICGATGFIGRNLVEAFAKRGDVEVHAVHNIRPPFDCANVTWHQADLRDPAAVTRVTTGMDVIIQAAATTSGSKDILTRPYIHTTDNAVMNSLLLRAAYDQSVGQFVFFSCTVMLPSGDTPLTEEDWDANEPIHPRYFGVGWTKVYIEKMSEFFSRLGRTRHTVIRHSNIYGPHDKFDLERSHVFGATVTKVLSADKSITVWGTGEEARDLLYVGDLCDFVERAVDKQTTPYELVNVGLGHAVTIKDLVGRIVAASGKALDILHDLSAPSIPTSLSLDCSKAKELFGWEPRTTLDDGIAKTIAWWRKHVGKEEPVA